jgi:hypothetical protein
MSTVVFRIKTITRFIIAKRSGISGLMKSGFAPLFHAWLSIERRTDLRARDEHIDEHGKRLPDDSSGIGEIIAHEVYRPALIHFFRTEY